jgi:hypothetical protein
MKCFPSMTFFLSVGFLLATPVSAEPLNEDNACFGERQKQDDIAQQDHMLNFFAAATTMSPLHGPMGGEPGHGTVGVDLLVMPPLSCAQRIVFQNLETGEGGKTEDTNKSPVVPRPHMSFTFPKLGEWQLYGTAAYIPPVPFAGTRNVYLGFELGAGRDFGGVLQTGLRFHASMLKAIGDIATKLNEDDEDLVDFYLASTMGIDLMLGRQIGKWTPYLSGGVLDVSTIFYVDDTGVMVNNTAPYFGPALSVGTEADLHERIALAVEFYTAPGVIYTGRVRAGLKF